MKRVAGAVLALASLLGAALSLRLVSRYVVNGRSMLRAYGPGDRILVERLSYRRRLPRIGEVVVLRLPGAGSRLDLKRIAAGPGGRVTIRGEDYILGADEWYVLGDNLGESQDSRQLGPVATADILGRVWRRY